MGYRIVVAGATGNVGREVLAILAEREFPIAELAAVASSRSQGDEIEIGDTGKTVKCQNIENFDWTGWDMAIFAIGSDATAIHAPKAAAARIKSRRSTFIGTSLSIGQKQQRCCLGTTERQMVPGLRPTAAPA